MEIKDTLTRMLSPDYRDRFTAEYQQTKIRRDKLDVLIRQAERGELDFALSCPLELLKRQRQAMEDYLLVLEERAKVEGIAL